MSSPSLYVQYMPDATSSEALVAMQRIIASQVNSGRDVLPEELHVTVLHFGHFDETFRQLTSIQQVLDRREYEASLHTFIDRLRAHLPKTCQLRLSGFERFGVSGGVLVARFEPDSAYMQAYDYSLEQLNGFLRSLDIDVSKLSDQPRALQIPTAPTPHISLRKSVKDEIDLPDLLSSYIDTKLQFDLFNLG